MSFGTKRATPHTLSGEASSACVAAPRDCRNLVVEDRGKNLARNPEELHKNSVGELWAARSEGRCGFAWVVDKY
jgi:hypothetical protein